MYYPYLRGKQNELLAVRESSHLLAESGFVPIIEPVRASLRPLEAALGAVADANGRAIVITNPRHGDYRHDGSKLAELVANRRLYGEAITAGILLTAATSPEDAIDLLSEQSDHDIAVIHAGFTRAEELATALKLMRGTVTNVFVDGHASRVYQRRFDASPRVLIHDGFEQKRNADYDPVDAFSDLHLTFHSDGFTGHGDFLIVGDAFTEGGGPAYAVAIHLTFIDPDQDDAMFVRHFVSDTNDTPTDPASKFGQALAKLAAELESGQSHLLRTNAVEEFLRLHEAQHFPGLGYVKKLSMIHHLETLAEYHGRAGG